MTARSVYDLGMDKYVPEDVYCVMLDTDSPLFYPEWLSMPIFQEALSSPPVPDHHVTLRYGIFPTVERSDIEEILSDYSPHVELEIRRDLRPFLTLGRSTDPFETIAVPLVTTPWLQAIHTELGCLPNISTFPEFTPHITIGMFKRGFWADLDLRLLPPLKQAVGPINFRITGGR